jgi:uncharacterized membrane protein YdjX (TVP38/TMEM64 family)
MARMKAAPPTTAGRSPLRPGSAPAVVARILVHPTFRLTVLAALIVAALTVVSVVGVPDPVRIRAELAVDAAWTPLAAVLAVATMALLLFPRAGVAVLAGLLFGPVPATVYAVLGTLLGATIAFGIGRALGRPFLTARSDARSERHRLVRLQRWLDQHGVLAVVYARIVPVLPFGLLNYSFGATRVSLRSFVAGTAAGIAPSTAVYAVLGASATDPGSPAFLVSLALIALIATGGTLHLRRTHRRSAASTRAQTG